MKTKNLMVLALSLSFATAYAQSNDEQVLNSAPINVDGYLQEERPVTDGELEGIRSELNKQKAGTQLNKEKAKDLGKLTNQTEKLLESQDEYIDQKIESTRAIQDFNQKYEEGQKKLKCIMEESNSAECDPYKNKYRKNQAKEEVQELKLKQAAPAITSSASVSNSGNPFETIRLLPYAGATTFNGQIEQLETELTAGIRLESNITSRFAIGVGFKYDQLKTNDFANNGPYMNQGYFGAFGLQGREILFRNMGLDMYGKFFITNGERFRPYVGAGLSYNRSSMRYNDNNPYYDQINAFYFGSEEYNTSFMSGQLMLGSQVMVTNSFGLNLEGSYSTGLGNSLASRSARNGGTSPDQTRLRDLGNEIIKSNALSIFAGAVVNF